MAVQADVQPAQQMLSHAVNILVHERKHPDADGKSQQSFQSFENGNATQTEMANEEAFGMMLHEWLGKQLF
jgi:hypothetical protein